jgi:hypothetical protein
MIVIGSTTNLCIQCSNKCNIPYVHLCDACFERGKLIEPPRQSGRTFKLIKQLIEDKNKILVVHSYVTKQHIERAYPLMERQIKTIDNIDWMRSMNGADILVDHMLHEYPLRNSYEFFTQLTMITSPSREIEHGNE